MSSVLPFLRERDNDSALVGVDDSERGTGDVEGAGRAKGEGVIDEGRRMASCPRGAW